MRTQYSIIILVMIFALLLINKNVIGQAASGNYQLSGKIVDSVTQQPLSFVTISLRDEKDTPVKVALTKDNGAFVFAEIQSMQYHLSIVAIGYQVKIIKLNLSKSLDLGVIYLKTQLNTLKEVSVTADRPIIKQKADRVIYDLQADPEGIGSSVLGMMHKIPFISVDADDNILLKGKANFKVLVNGKPSGMFQDNLKAILSGIAASTIQSIEIITVPPSKYDAEGLAGIINIITKKVKSGYNGTVNINDNFPVGGPGVGASFTAQQGKFGISAFGGGSIYNSPQTNYSNKRETFTAPTLLMQGGTNKSNNKSGYFGTELSYEIDTLNLLSGQFNTSGNGTGGTTYQQSLLTGSSTILQGYNLNNNNTSNRSGFNAAINYQLGFKADKNRLLTFSYSYDTYTKYQNSNIDLFNEVNTVMPGYQQNNNEKFEEQSFQVDYVHPIKKLFIEAGLKGVLRNNTSDFEYLALNAADGLYISNPALSDKYTNTQNIFGAYNSYRLELKSWSFSAGVRVEQTVTHANFISAATSVNQNYFNVIPALAVSTTLADQSSFNAGFSQRIKRPGINRLDPFVDRSDPDFETTGNPNLRSVLVNDIQAGYALNKKLSLTIGFDYSYIKNIDLAVTTFNPVTNITTSTYQNAGKGSGLGGNLNMSYPVTKRYHLSLNGNVMYIKLQGILDNALVNNNRLMYFAALSNGYNFNSGWRLNADLTIISASPTGLQGSSNEMVSSAFGFNKQLIKDKLSCSAGIKNPFTKYRNNKITTPGPDFEQLSINRGYFRAFYVSVNYNFGQLKQGIKKSKTEIENNDVSK